MKLIKLLFLFSMVSYNTMFSKNLDWEVYKIDSLVSLKLPSEPLEMDTVAEKLHMTYYTSYSDYGSFMIQKSAYENKYQNEDLSDMPYDSASLEDFYDMVIKGMNKRMPYIMKTKKTKNRNTFSGYELGFKDPESSDIIHAEVYLLNKNLYTFFYYSIEDLGKEEQNEFFNSILISPNKSITQFTGKSKGYRHGYIFGKILAYGTIFAIFGFFILRNRKRRIRRTKKLEALTRGLES